MFLGDMLDFLYYTFLDQRTHLFWIYFFCQNCWNKHDSTTNSTSRMTFGKKWLRFLKFELNSTNISLIFLMRIFFSWVFLVMNFSFACKLLRTVFFGKLVVVYVCWNFVCLLKRNVFKSVEQCHSINHHIFRRWNLIDAW